MRSKTKKQFSSSWKAYRRLTTKGWSIYKHKSILSEGGGEGLGADLLEKPPLLDDIAHRLHLHGLHFVDILERVRCPGLFVLNHSDLGTFWVRAGGREGEWDRPSRMRLCQRP